MDVAEFEDLLDRLGEDVSTWPNPQRQAARDLLAQSEAARTLLEEAKLLRRTLARPPVEAPAGLAERILDRARSSETPKSSEDGADEPAARPPKRG